MNSGKISVKKGFYIIIFVLSNSETRVGGTDVRKEKKNIIWLVSITKSVENLATKSIGSESPWISMSWIIYICCWYKWIHPLTRCRGSTGYSGRVNHTPLTKSTRSPCAPKLRMFPCCLRETQQTIFMILHVSSSPFFFVFYLCSFIIVGVCTAQKKRRDFLQCSHRTIEFAFAFHLEVSTHKNIKKRGRNVHLRISSWKHLLS